MIAALALAMTACSTPEATPEATPRVSVVTVGPQVVQRDDELPGRVAAVRTAQIRAQVGGIVQRRLFDQGAEVSAGQALFQIDPAAFRADVDSALAALQRSEAALGRSRVQSQRLHALAAAQAVSQQHRDDASAEYEQARAAVNEARAILARRQLDLRYATVSAPIAGRIDQALVTEGALVGVADAVDARTGDVILRILVDNPQRQLLPGMYVRARVPRGAPASALTVPQQAVLRSAGGQAYAWVIGGDGKAVIRTLEVDGSVDRQWLVRTGLKAGEKVVVEGQERLQEGVVVDARDWQMPVASAGAVQAGSKG